MRVEQGVVSDVPEFAGVAASGGPEIVRTLVDRLFERGQRGVVLAFQGGFDIHEVSLLPCVGARPDQLV
jgi:hypothetical protein